MSWPKKFQSDTTFAQLSKKLLKNGVCVIDGGARNFFSEVYRLAPHTDYFGFEPNEVEYKKILAMKSPFRNTTVSPFALLKENQKASLFITKNPGATSTLLPNKDLLKHFTRDNWGIGIKVENEEPVEGKTLEYVFDQNNIQHVDYMKLDTQGNELGILESAGSHLSKISVIKAEVEMIPIYENQPLLGDIFNFLTKRGFELIDIQWRHTNRRYHFSPDLAPDSYRLVWGDAIFAYDPVNFSNKRKPEQAIILAELGYTDLALYIFENIDLGDAALKEEVINFYKLPRHFRYHGALQRFFKKFLPRRINAAISAFRNLPEKK